MNTTCNSHDKDVLLILMVNGSLRMVNEWWMGGLWMVVNDGFWADNVHNKLSTFIHSFIITFLMSH